MLKSAPLTIAFIENRPLAAARALAGLDPADAGALLEVIPARIAAHALTNVGEWPASLIIVCMDAASGAAALRELPYAQAAAMLRLIPPEPRDRLLDQTSEALRRDFETSLSFPEDTVGAHMTTGVITLTSDHTVSEAADLIRRSPDTATDVVFIVEDGRTMVGAVSVGMLLRSPGSITLGAVMDPNVPMLSARARLATIDDLDAWDERMVLPVMSRRKQIIGALSREHARKAAEDGRSKPMGAPSSILGAMAEAFAISASGVGEMLAGVGAPTRPRKGGVR